MKTKNDKDILVRLEANVGSYQTFFSYLNSYHEAFRILIDQTKKSNNHIDTILFPCLYLVRHSLELGFKVNIKYFSKYSNRTDHINSTSHSLKDLFDAFKLHVNSTVSELKTKHSIVIDKNDLIEFKGYCKDVNELVKIFEQLDHTSQSFRYPVDQNNNAVFKGITKLNLLAVEDLFNKSMILLKFTSSVFGQYTQEIDYMNELFENELRNSLNTCGY